MSNHKATSHEGESPQALRIGDLAPEVKLRCTSYEGNDSMLCRYLKKAAGRPQVYESSGQGEPIDYISIGHIPNTHIVKRNVSIVGTKDDSWLMVLFHAGSFSTVDDAEVRLLVSVWWLHSGGCTLVAALCSGVLYLVAALWCNAQASCLIVAESVCVSCLIVQHARLTQFCCQNLMSHCCVHLGSGTGESHRPVVGSGYPTCGGVCRTPRDTQSMAKISRNEAGPFVTFPVGV